MFSNDFCLFGARAAAAARRSNMFLARAPHKNMFWARAAAAARRFNDDLSCSLLLLPRPAGAQGRLNNQLLLVLHSRGTETKKNKQKAKSKSLKSRSTPHVRGSRSRKPSASRPRVPVSGARWRVQWCNRDVPAALKVGQIVCFRVEAGKCLVFLPGELL